MILTPAELASITARSRPSAQRRVLDALGVRYAARPDGTLSAMAATTAREEGVSAQALMGHKSARTTEIYLRSKVVPVVRGPKK